MASDPAAPHAYVRHHDRKPGCAVCGNLRKDPVHGKPTGYPKQLDGMARLMPLTPELRAHYACDPALNCDHPECQP